MSNVIDLEAARLARSHAEPTYNALHDPDAAALKAECINGANDSFAPSLADFHAWWRQQERTQRGLTKLTRKIERESGLAKLERRCKKVARQCAKIVIELRAAGDVEAARRFETAAIETVEAMRARKA